MVTRNLELGDVEPCSLESRNSELGNSELGIRLLPIIPSEIRQIPEDFPENEIRENENAKCKRCVSLEWGDEATATCGGGGVLAFRVFAPPHPCPRPLPSPLHPTTPIPKGGLCGAFFLKGDSG